MKLYEEDFFIAFDEVYKSGVVFDCLDYCRLASKKNNTKLTYTTQKSKFFYNWIRERGLVDEYFRVSKKIIKNNEVR